MTSAIVIVVIFALISNASCSLLCQCSCCVGNSCKPENVGSISITSCPQCTEQACAASYSVCPSGTSRPGLNSADCASSSSSNSIYWSGTYEVHPGCSTNSCCCLTGDVTVTLNGDTIYLSSFLEGDCQGAGAMNNVSLTLSSVDAGSAKFSYLGNNYLVTRSGQDISVQDLSASTCSGSATCISGSCIRPGPWILVFALLAAFVVLLLIGLAVYSYISRKRDYQRIQQ